MLIETLKIAGKEYINVPIDNLSIFELSDNQISQIIGNEAIKNAKREVNLKRDALLLKTDYLVMPDYPLIDKTAVEIYRQSLRDITLQVGYPLNIEWPEIAQG